MIQYVGPVLSHIVALPTLLIKEFIGGVEVTVVLQGGLVLSHVRDIANTIMHT